MLELEFLLEEAPDGVFLARAKGESIFTEAKTLEELEANIRAAVSCHFDDSDACRIPSYRLQMV